MTKIDVVASAQRAGRFPTKARLCRESGVQASFFLIFLTGVCQVELARFCAQNAPLVKLRLRGVNRTENSPARIREDAQTFGLVELRCADVCVERVDRRLSPARQFWCDRMANDKSVGHQT